MNDITRQADPSSVNAKCGRVRAGGAQVAPFPGKAIMEFEIIDGETGKVKSKHRVEGTLSALDPSKPFPVGFAGFPTEPNQEDSS